MTTYFAVYSNGESHRKEYSFELPPAEAITRAQEWVVGAYNYAVAHDMTVVSLIISTDAPSPQVGQRGEWW